MAHRTDIDELVDYSYKARSLIINNQEIMALIADDPNYDLDGDTADEIEARVKDHDYVDETTLIADAYVMVETEMTNLSSPTMKTMYLYVNVVLSKKFMDMNPKKFKGYKGNRRDNIARLINNLLNDNRDFGVGDLKLISATVGSVPTGFTSRILTYEVPSFSSYGISV